MNPEQLLQDRSRLFESGGMVQLDWTLLRVYGRDTASFLHNMTTNDIRSLDVDAFCETYVVDVRGKVVGHGFVIRMAEESFLFLGAPGQLEALTAHWERYVITEDVQLECLASQMSLWACGGPSVDDWADEVDEVENGQQLLDRMIFDVPVRWIPIRAFGDRIKTVLVMSAEQGIALKDRAAERKLLSVASETWESLRIEAGFPLYGIDITIANLPQEVRRDAQAINFTKGCYLGQETVARIDAIGHVNWHLVGLKCGNTRWSPGQELHQGEKTVARIGSQAWVPQLECTLSLAYVRRGSETAGARLQTDEGEVEVVGLPLGSGP